MRRSLGLVGLLTCLLWAPEAPAFQKPAPKDRVLPDFDTPPGRARRRRQSTRRPPEVNQRLEALRSRLAHPLRLRTHPITGAARLLWAEGEPLSEAAPSPRAAARARSCRRTANLLGLEGAGPDSLVLTREEPLLGGALTRLVLDQVVDGIPVFQGVVIVHVDGLGPGGEGGRGSRCIAGEGKGNPLPFPPSPPKRRLRAPCPT